MLTPVKRAEVKATRLHGNPKLRLDSLGYTLRSGSPTAYQVKLVNHGERWRRVYVICFSNVASHFVKIRGEAYYISLDVDAAYADPQD